jgi:copper resistance protein C
MQRSSEAAPRRPSSEDHAASSALARKRARPQRLRPAVVTLLSFNRARMSRRVSPVIACLPFLFAVAAAHAHAVLVNATPAPNATVAPPSEIRLEFSEGVEPRFSGVTLSATAGGAAELGVASVEAGHPDVLIVPIAKPITPGVYTVHWHAVSADTHRTQGTFKFTVK